MSESPAKEQEGIESQSFVDVLIIINQIEIIAHLIL